MINPPEAKNQLPDWIPVLYLKSGTQAYTIDPKDFDNLTNDVTYAKIEGITAVNYFNTMGMHNNYYPSRIPDNIDFQMYKPVMFFKTLNGVLTECYTYFLLNVKLLTEKLLQNQPTDQFFFQLMSDHMRMCWSNPVIKNDNKYNVHEEVIKKIRDKALIPVKQTDRTPDISQIFYIKPKLFDYQKSTIYWMLEKETSMNSFRFCDKYHYSLGDLTIDIAERKVSHKENMYKNINFYGGGLIEEMGLGKTLEIATISLLNPMIEEPNSRMLNSSATLILCPNQLCHQWKRELESYIKSDLKIKIVPMLTKRELDKVSYQQLMDADFVIVSYTLLMNKVYLEALPNYFRGCVNATWMQEAPTDLKKEIDKNQEDIKTSGNKNPVVNYLDKTNVLLTNIHWHRFVVDEFHETYSCNKYKNIIKMLPYFKSTHRWCVTGTPFPKRDSLKEMIKFLSNSDHRSNTFANMFAQDGAVEFFSELFRRNTKESIKTEYQIPPIIEKLKILDFTPTERVMYDAYLNNPNHDKYSVYLRQLCCHPNLALETKEMLSTCKTLKDIETLMLVFYETEMKQQETRVENLKARVERYTKQLFDANNVIKIETKPLEVKEEKIPEAKPVANPDVLLNIPDAKEAVVEVGAFEYMPVRDYNQHGFGEHINIEVDPIILLEEKLIDTQELLQAAEKELIGKSRSYNFFKTVVDKLKEKKLETCAICLCDAIPESDVGITSCGHIYCYDCLKQVIQNASRSCPSCRAELNKSSIYRLTYDKPEEKKEAVEKKNKTADLIDKVGTKLAHVIKYIKKRNRHTIIFSQWDDLLTKVGKTLTENGMQNVFCKGNVHMRANAIKRFNDDKNVKIIMLSSESAASGTNLTKASQIIFLDPVYGTIKFRQDIENQAIGRAHRIGQRRRLRVVRFVIRNTIEEEIYLENKKQETIPQDIPPVQVQPYVRVV
jgi:SNF2 family DNA or RNA helicase